MIDFEDHFSSMSFLAVYFHSLVVDVEELLEYNFILYNSSSDHKLVRFHLPIPFVAIHFYNRCNMKILWCPLRITDQWADYYWRSIESCM